MTNPTSPQEAKLDWVRNALKVEGYECTRDWIIDLGGPCRFATNNVVALCLRMPASTPLMMPVGQMGELPSIRNWTRDYGMRDHWGDLPMDALREWCLPENWYSGTRHEMARYAAFVLPDGYRALFNRGLVWRAFQNLEAKTVRIDCTDRLNPIHFTAPGWRLVVMPMTPPEDMDMVKVATWSPGKDRPIPPTKCETCPQAKLATKCSEWKVDASESRT
jgi:hypothetical protein